MTDLPRDKDGNLYENRKRENSKKVEFKTQRKN